MPVIFVRRNAQANTTLESGNRTTAKKQQRPHRRPELREAGACQQRLAHSLERIGDRQRAPSIARGTGSTDTGYIIPPRKDWMHPRSTTGRDSCGWNSRRYGRNQDAQAGRKPESKPLAIDRGPTSWLRQSGRESSHSPGQVDHVRIASRTNGYGGGGDENHGRAVFP